jgi:hypothetical protein
VLAGHSASSSTYRAVRARRTPWARSRTARKATERAPGDQVDPDLSEIPGSRRPSVSVADAVRVAATHGKPSTLDHRAVPMPAASCTPATPDAQVPRNRTAAVDPTPTAPQRRDHNPIQTWIWAASLRPAGPERCRGAETAPCAAPVAGTGAPPRPGNAPPWRSRRSGDLDRLTSNAERTQATLRVPLKWHSPAVEVLSTVFERTP